MTVYTTAVAATTTTTTTMATTMATTIAMAAIKPRCACISSRPYLNKVT